MKTLLDRMTSIGGSLTYSSVISFALKIDCANTYLPVCVSFDPISYTVTEGDGFAELILIRSGDLSRTTVVTVTTADGSATGERLI